MKERSSLSRKSVQVAVVNFWLDSGIRHGQDTRLEYREKQVLSYVRLEAATEPSVRQALIAAWRNTAPKRLARLLDDE
jgi:hypothetical protein